MKNVHCIFYRAALAATLLLIPVAAGAQTVVEEVPSQTVETTVTQPATIVSTAPASVALAGVPVQFPSGTVIVPTSPGPENGYLYPAGGGHVHYWSDGGATYYQYFDTDGHRHKRVRL